MSSTNVPAVRSSSVPLEGLPWPFPRPWWPRCSTLIFVSSVTVAVTVSPSVVVTVRVVPSNEAMVPIAFLPEPLPLWAPAGAVSEARASAATAARTILRETLCIHPPSVAGLPRRGPWLCVPALRRVCSYREVPSAIYRPGVTSPLGLLQGSFVNAVDEVAQRLEDGGRAGVAELVFREPAGQDCD